MENHPKCSGKRLGRVGHKLFQRLSIIKKKEKEKEKTASRISSSLTWTSHGFQSSKMSPHSPLAQPFTTCHVKKTHVILPQINEHDVRSAKQIVPRVCFLQKEIKIRPLSKTTVSLLKTT